MKKATLRFLFVLLSGLPLCLGGKAGAQTVPAAIKYQAVLRDVTGGVLASRENVDIRITLRLNDPQTGTILYEEDFKDMATNAYGLVHLNIGTGERTQGHETLLEVPWGTGDIYAQVQIQMDGGGYTNMGTSELLTVPYAFMAANAKSAQIDFSMLEDGDIPKYNQAGNNLIPSRVRVIRDTLRAQAKAFTVSNPWATGAGVYGYMLPTTAGRNKQVLLMTDQVVDGFRVAQWSDMEGGPGGEGGDGWKGEEGDDERLLYWNEITRGIKSAALLYHYKTDSSLEVVYDLYVDHIFHADTILSDTVYTVALRTHRLYVDSLFGDKGFMGLLYADRVEADTLLTDTASFHRLFAGRIWSDYLYADTLEADSAYMNRLYAETLRSEAAFTDTLSAGAAWVGRLHTDTLIVDTVGARAVGTRLLYAENAQIETLEARRLQADTAIVDSLFAQNLRADTALIDTLSTRLFHTEEAYVDYLSAKRLRADTASVDTLYAQKFQADTAAADTLYAQKLHADTADMDTLYAHRLHADSAWIDSLYATLPKGQIWIGDGRNLNTPHTISGIITLDTAGVSKLNLAFGPGLIYADTSTTHHQRDSLYMDQNLEMWLQNTSDPHVMYAYNTGIDSIRVGIGTDSALAALHVQDGDVLFRDTLATENRDTLSYLYWNGTEGSFLVGGYALDPMNPQPLGWKNPFGRFSVAMGLESEALADYSMALGKGAKVSALGRNAFAMGNLSLADDTNVVAIGYRSQATGKHAIAMGYAAQAEGEGSIVIGPNIGIHSPSTDNDHLYVYAPQGISIGTTSIEKNADGSIAIGSNAPLEHSKVIVVGTSNTLDSLSVVVGNNNTVPKGSIIIGNNAINKGGGSSFDKAVVIGRSYIPRVITGNVESPEFTEFGTGMVVVGSIATETPNVVSVGSDNLNELNYDNASTKISQTVVMLGNQLRHNITTEHKDELTKAESEMAKEIIMLGSGYSSGNWYQQKKTIPQFVVANRKNNLMMCIDHNNDAYFMNDVHIHESLIVGNDGGEGKVDCLELVVEDGEVSFEGSDVSFEGSNVSGLDVTVSVSDIRLKEDILPFSHPLSWLDSVQSLSFVYKSDAHRQTHLGFVAQQVQKFFPQLVGKNKKGYLNLNYIEFVPVLWDFSAQLRRQNLELEKKNAELQQQNLELQQRMEAVEAEMAVIKEKLGL